MLLSTLHRYLLRWLPNSSRQSALAVLAILAGSVALSGCGGSGPPIPTITTQPSRADIIEAVRRGVNGKTYTEMVVQQEPRTRTCSQMDVDFDPYMPRNPELAKCPYAGYTFTVRESVSRPKTRTCPSLPKADQPGWYVEDRGEDRWRVSHGGSTWDVEKIEGGAANVEEFIKVSSFVFTIKARQAC